jgi:DNA-directed RNA polymerase subunit RPC12/RpoP
VTRTYRCQSCGAAWVSYPAGEAIEQEGRCLRCDSALFLDEPPAKDPAGPRAETDASPPLPNGLEDDPET